MAGERPTYLAVKPSTIPTSSPVHLHVQVQLSAVAFSAYEAVSQVEEVVVSYKHVKCDSSSSEGEASVNQSHSSI